jgi:hypothetical protein
VNEEVPEPRNWGERDDICSVMVHLWQHNGGLWAHLSALSGVIRQSTYRG